MSDKFISRWLDDNKIFAYDLSAALFSCPELAEEEHQSAAVLKEYMERNGFHCEMGIGGMATAFRAHWGKNGPVIGFLAEYDALPGLSQPAGQPVYQGDGANPGHGCGHNLLGSACAFAAAALKTTLEAEHLPGQVVLYGCPAEEILKGKIEMAKNGCFRDLDVAISWHPSDLNRTGNTLCQAMDSIHFSFHGKSAHAAAAPHLGRSALDACELMNIGVNYLREHITDGERIHYIYEDGGVKPNVVPDHAKVWYYVRGRDRDTVNSTTERVLDIARGAALMTSTQVEWTFESRGYETLMNHTLNEAAYQIMQKLPIPQYSQEELDFAQKLSENISSKPDFYQGIEPYRFGEVRQAFGSSDFSDVSQLVPAIALRVVCMPIGTPLHHWATTACSGSTIGKKGMLYAAQIMAQLGMELIQNPRLLQQAQEEFQNNAKGWWK